MILRKLLRASNESSAHRVRYTSFPGPHKSFNYDFRGYDFSCQADDLHQLSYFRCELVHRDPPSVSFASTQTADTEEAACSSTSRDSHKLDAVRELELNILESETRYRCAIKHLTFWRSLASNVLFSALLPAVLSADGTPSMYQFILSSNEWFLYDETFTDNDPILCIATKCIKVSIELSSLRTTVTESEKLELVLFFSEYRDKLKLFLAALSYSNIPVSIFDRPHQSDSVSVGLRE